MKRVRMITVENCCKRAIAAFKIICDDLNKYGTADETDFSYKIKRLNKIIREEKNSRSIRKISETMCAILTLVLENDKVAELFYKDNFILDFSTRFSGLEVPDEYKATCSKKLREFFERLNDNDENINMALSIAANIMVFYDDIEINRIKLEFYRNLNRLNSASIYFAVINNLIGVDQKVLGRIKTLCIENKENSIAEAASINNPVYVLLHLYQHKCVKNIQDYNEILSDNNMFLMVTRPSAFDAENFRAQWWKLLADPHLQEKIARNKKNTLIIINRMEEYRDKCFGSNIIFYNDIINALGDFSRIAR